MGSHVAYFTKYALSNANYYLQISQIIKQKYVLYTRIANTGSVHETKHSRNVT
jgi:hypothetical protein